MPSENEIGENLSYILATTELQKHICNYLYHNGRRNSLVELNFHHSVTLDFSIIQNKVLNVVKCINDRY